MNTKPSGDAEVERIVENEVERHQRRTCWQLKRAGIYFRMAREQQVQNSYLLL